MHDELVNFVYFARAVAKASWMTGIGPGVVVMGLYNFRSHWVPKFFFAEKAHVLHIVPLKRAA